MFRVTGTQLDPVGHSLESLHSKLHFAPEAQRSDPQLGVSVQEMTCPPPAAGHLHSGIGRSQSNSQGASANESFAPGLPALRPRGPRAQTFPSGACMSSVVIVHDEALEWDSHGDIDGSGARRPMRERLVKGLRIFLDRMLSDPSLDVTVALVSESIEASRFEHASVLSAPVIGRSVRVATTGVLSPPDAAPDSAPAHQGMWSLLADLGGPREIRSDQTRTERWWSEVFRR